MNMNQFKAYKDSYFKEKSRILGNCYIIKENTLEYHYEVLPQNTEAIIIADTSNFLEEIAKMHHQEHPNILHYYTKDSTFSIYFDEVHTFKLPISILQVSKLFLNEEYLTSLKMYCDPEAIYVPVKIIEDEYVILDKHHEVYLAYEYGLKMVNVYLASTPKDILNPLYIAKEQNIRTIPDMKHLSNEEYELISKQLEALFQSI